jgi:hypothetical protein
MGGTCSTYREKEKCMQALIKKPQRKRLRGSHRRRWVYNNKMDLDGIG